LRFQRLAVLSPLVHHLAHGDDSQHPASDDLAVVDPIRVIELDLPALDNATRRPVIVALSGVVEVTAAQAIKLDDTARRRRRRHKIATHLLNSITRNLLRDQAPVALAFPAVKQETRS
jgi:hypothetical protein